MRGEIKTKGFASGGSNHRSDRKGANIAYSIFIRVAKRSKGSEKGGGDPVILFRV